MSNMPMTPESARRRMRALRELYVHASIYAIMNLLLFLMDVLTPGGPWFFWPLLGWGVGLGAHAVSVLAEQRLWGDEWEARKIDRWTTPRR